MTKYTNKNAITSGINVSHTGLVHPRGDITRRINPPRGTDTYRATINPTREIALRIAPCPNPRPAKIKINTIAKIHIDMPHSLITARIKITINRRAFFGGKIHVFRRFPPRGQEDASGKALISRTELGSYRD